VEGFEARGDWGFKSPRVQSLKWLPLSSEKLYILLTPKIDLGVYEI